MDNDWIRIYLVRHGHVNYFDENHQPVNPKYAVLSELGIQQIQAVADLIRNIQFDEVYSSTMPRSIQTAEVLLAKHDGAQAIQFCDEICEIRSGRLREIEPQQALQMIQYAYRFHSQHVENFMLGEKWSDFESRILTWFESILFKLSQPKQILISSHDAVNRVLINWMYDQVGQDIYVQEQDYGCLNILDIEIHEDRICNKRIKLQNYTPYNPAKLNLFNSAMDDVYQAYTQMKQMKES
ncbi:histidine phosphatase family protein [Acinetobacter lactucae]|uniref:Histidine phosphatase family protein n=1 Tax=Acinetobacter lactucae TaxID=1785128 RepID=A0A3R9QVG8_9GAMM|nr:histidine phosphatase family protein [Acinetobacter lactucae]RSO58811.1 histidine phosphatase family protein [Acinetobacter lactucae]